MAEAILNEIGAGRFKAYSAGSHPSGTVNPFTIELLKANGLAFDDLRSKPWDEFGMQGAPEMDLVITVCDQAAGEICPIWPGHPITAHWGFEDPAAFQGTDDEKREIFKDVYWQIMSRMRLLLNLPFSALDRFANQQKLREIGQVKP
jgi:arsenate reductase